MLSEPGVRPALRRDLEAVRALLRAYRAEVADSHCFADFEQELATLPGRQVPPLGGLWILEAGGDALGCVALLPCGREAGEAELRRLYIHPKARGKGLARRLVATAVEAARGAGHRRLRLETLPGMTAAQALYRALGWQEAKAPAGRLGFTCDLAARQPAA